MYEKEPTSVVKIGEKGKNTATACNKEACI